MKQAVLGVTLIVGLGVFFWLKPFAKTTDNKSLTIGMMSGWPPFMAITQQGAFEGFDVDVANELCTRLSRPCKIIDMGALTTLFVALEQKKIDMIFSGLDITKARREKLNMIPYYGESVREYSLLFWNKIPDGISSLEDLKSQPNPTVVVEPGDSPEKLIDQFPFIQKKQVASLADQILELKYQKSLALFREPHIARQLMRQNPELKALSVTLPPELQIFGMGVAVKKDNVVLNDNVNATLSAMKSDGTIDRIAARWFPERDNE